MPHQCTNCGRRFADGSKEMLSGCPDCGGNKFQFIPGGAGRGESDAAPTAPASDDDSPGPDRPAETSVQAELPTDESTVSTDQGSPQPDRRSEPSSPTPDQQSEPSSPTPDQQSEPSGQPAEQPSDSSASAAREFLSRLKGGTGDDGTAEASTSAEADTAAGDDDVDDDADIIEPRDTGPIAAETSDEEDYAQHDARSATVPTDELREVREQLAREATGAAAEADVEGSQPARDDTPPAEGSTPAGQAGGEVADGTTDVADSAAAAADADEVADSATAAADTEELETPANPDLAQLRAELNDQFESIKIVAPGQYELNLMELYDREEYVISLQEDGRYIIEVPDAWDADTDDED